MKKFLLSIIFVSIGVISVFSQTFKVENGTVKINNPQITDVYRKTSNFQIVSHLSVFMLNEIDSWMQIQTGTTNPRIAGSGDCVVFYNGGTSTFNDIQIRNMYQYSDRNAKTNIVPVFNATDKVKNLNPVTFNWKKNDPSISSNSITEKQEIGFIAQEVEQVLPDAVTTDNEGNKLVNYSAIIPILTEAIKELTEKVENLERQISNSANNNAVKKLQGNNVSSVDITAKAILYQNNPNPTSGATKISFRIPKITTSAYICIFDLQGSLVSKEQVTNSGDGSITISAGKLNAGMYLYSLIVDDKLIDTKRMVLTN